MNRPKRGNVRMPYSEIFRVIGAYVDRNDLSEVRLLETDDGLILQGVVLSGARAGERDTYQLTVEDVLVLLEDARALRGKKI